MSEADAPAKTVRDPESFKQALQQWTGSRLPDAKDLRVDDVDMPKATGFSNETVFYTISWAEGSGRPTRRLVARIEPRDGGIFPVQTPACADSVTLQYRIMRAVEKTGVAPVAPTIGYEADRAVLGSPFFVMEFIDGVIPADVPRYSQAGFLVDEATPAERERMMLSGIEAMAALNRLDWRETDLGWLDVSGEGKPTLGLQLGIYRDYVMRELAGREHPVMMRALDWLESNVPAGESGLSWGDSRLANVIWQDYRPAAVVDWEAAALCPPDADIGWWVMFDRMSFDDMGAERLAGFPTREEMVAHWEEQVGRKLNGDIHYWEVYAVMRFCAIMIRLGDRFVRAGFMPEEQSTSVANGVTDALARRLGIEQG